MVQKNKKVSILSSVLFSVCLAWPLVGQAATLYLSPESQTVYQEDSFLVEVRIDTEGEEINAVEAYLEFPANLLNAVDFIKRDSILPLFAVEPKIQSGKISFAAGAPNGFQGDGLLAQITFKATRDEQQKARKAIVSFKEDSKVLLNDGKGTEARLDFLTGNYEVMKKPEGLPTITSETHPEQNKWHQSTNLSLYWALIKDAEYSYLLSRDSSSEPDKIPDKPEGELVWVGAMEYDLKEEGDGIYYFHLRERRETEAKPEHETEAKLGWGPKVTFRIMIDSTSPEDFDPQIGQDSAVLGGKYFLSFTSQDKTSGIAYYEITEISRILGNFFQKEKWVTVESPYPLNDQKLRSIIKLKAVDKAGNERIVEVVPPYKVSWQDVIIVLLVLSGIGVIWQIIKKFRDRKHNRN